MFSTLHFRAPYRWIALRRFSFLSIVEFYAQMYQRNMEKTYAGKRTPTHHAYVFSRHLWQGSRQPSNVLENVLTNLLS